MTRAGAPIISIGDKAGLGGDDLCLQASKRMELFLSFASANNIYLSIGWTQLDRIANRAREAKAVTRDHKRVKGEREEVREEDSTEARVMRYKSADRIGRFAYEARKL